MLTEFVGNWRLWYCCLTNIHISTCILPSTVVGTTTCIKKLDCNSPTDWVTCRSTQCTPLGAAPWWSLTPLTRLLLVTDRACVCPSVCRDSVLSRMNRCNLDLGWCKESCFMWGSGSPCCGWLGSRVVSVLDSCSVGPGFKSQLRRCRVTVLGKLFTPIVPLFTKQRNW